MQKWLEDNDILMYQTHNESESVVAERFIKTLKGKTYKKLTAKETKSYFGYRNKLESKYSNTYHRSISKKPISADYSPLAEEIKSNH